MSANQHDSSALSLNNISKIKGFYYLPILKDDSVSPRFSEISPRKSVNVKKNVTLPNPVKSLTSSVETPFSPANVEVRPPETISEEDVLAVRRLESAHSPRILEMPVHEEVVVDPYQERVIVARRLKPKSRGNLVFLSTNTSEPISTEYVHHFIDEEAESELPSPYLYDSRQDFAVAPLNMLEAASLTENSSTYDNTIVSDYRYILDPASSASPSRQQEPSATDSLLFNEEFLTYSAITIGSRPNSRPASTNVSSGNRSRKNSSARTGLTSGGSPVTKSISISLGNTPSGVVTVEDMTASPTVGASGTVMSSPSQTVGKTNTNHSPQEPAPSGISVSPNVVRRSSQRVVVSGAKNK